MSAARGLKAKRQKTGPPTVGPPLPSPINLGLLAPESRKELREATAASGPYTHTVLHPLCDDARLRGCFGELQNNLSTTFKETDLFKVYQTGDLAVWDTDPEVASKIPELLSLRAAIYGPEFREFIQDITQCGPLSDKVDISCNIYAHGGHLLCHDDVIGTRRVSFIIYLTEPDEGWTAEDGGMLELYPLTENNTKVGVPETEPTVFHLPRWNSMCLFTVRPGASFHAVQEVFGERKIRMSISGWYHAADLPENMEMASLSQLQARRGEDEATDIFDPLPGLAPSAAAAAAGSAAASADDLAAADDPPPDLTEAELALLRKWVNPEYLTKEARKQISDKFKEDNSIQLRDFLLREKGAQIMAAGAKADAADKVGKGVRPEYRAGYGHGWAPVGPPHKQRYLSFGGAPAPAWPADPSGPDCGAMLGAVRHELFGSEAFAKLLWGLTELHPIATRSEVRRFRPGLDYTVAHYGRITQEGRLDATLSFVDDVGEEKQGAWDSGEVGGFECYLAADDEQEGTGAADVYRANDTENDLLSVTACRNTLSLVHRDEGIMRFIKYVSSAAPGSRWDIAAEFKIVPPPPAPSDEEEDEEEEEGEGNGAQEGGDE